MLLEYLSLLAFFVILLSLALSSWQILQTRKILTRRMTNNISLWHLHETALEAQDELFMGEEYTSYSLCNRLNSDTDLSLLSCVDKQKDLELSILVSNR